MKVYLIYLIFFHRRSFTSAVPTRQYSNDVPYFEIATQSPYFVDKTMLLQTFLFIDLPIITCPKDFGKSTNLDMARRFFEMHLNPSNGQRIHKNKTRAYEIFTNDSLNLQISRNRTFVEKHLGEYPSLYFNFGKVQGTTYQEIINSTCQIIREAFVMYEWLLKVIEIWHNTGRKYPETTKRMSHYSLVLSNRTEVYRMTGGLYALMEFIKKYYNKEPMVFIDDYDAPMLQAINHGVSAEDINFYMRSILAIFVKTPVRASHVMMVGTSRLFRSDMVLDRISTVSYHYFLDDHGYSNYFGFTETEVNRLLDIANVPNNERLKIKKYYNGYLVKATNTSLYNPKGILHYLKTKTLKNIHDTIPLIRGIMKCARNPPFFQEIIEVLINKKVRRILPHHMRRLLLIDFAQLVENNCTEIKFNITEDYILPFYDQGFFTNTSHKYQYEVDDDIITIDEYYIPNKMMEENLLQEFVHYYQTIHNVAIVSSDISSSFSTLLESNETTKEMLNAISTSLFEVIKIRLEDRIREFEFQNILIGALLINTNFRPDVRLKMCNTSEEAWFEDFDKVKIASYNNDMLLLIKITFKRKDATEGIEEIRNYIPFEPSTSSKWKMVKYMVLNIKGVSRVEVADGESREIWI